MRRAVSKKLWLIFGTFLAIQNAEAEENRSAVFTLDSDRKTGVSLPSAPVEIKQDVKKDLRRNALREAALSYGLRLGLAEQSQEIDALLQKQRKILSRIFYFRSLLIELSSGVFLQPPVIIEADQGISLEENGRVAALADKTYRILAPARLVMSEQGWEEYLTLPLETIDPPPKVLFPRTGEEEEIWHTHLEEGKKQGQQQAREIFEENLSRLERDFTGQITYRLLLSQGLITRPYVAHKNRGITGDNIVLRISDQEVRVTADAAFQHRKEKWTPQLY
jgi:defect-in-organelle-trafficking protein DotC